MKQNILTLILLVGCLSAAHTTTGKLLQEAFSAREAPQLFRAKIERSRQPTSPSVAKVIDWNFLRRCRIEGCIREKRDFFDNPLTLPEA
jgi:hypothetical protein